MHGDDARALAQRLVGGSPAMARLRREIAALAPFDTSVLVTGETGAGKGVAARALHELSPRRALPFVHADCASLPRTLFESELFGHERGAFTGAVARRAGRFERARGGTIFLDEVGELDPSLQASLLCVLQERAFERVGGGAPVGMTARVVAATSRDLRAEVKAGRFRADLYFRLDVARVRLPPLRERIGDLPGLADSLLARISRRLQLPPPRLAPSALARLASHRWPGNVRELENALERMALRLRGGVVCAEDVAEALESALPAEPLRGEDVAAALRESGGNLTRAARALGVPRTTLRRRWASARAEQARQLGEHELERDAGQHQLVELHEAGLAHAVEQRAADAGAGGGGRGEYGERKQPAREGEARGAEHDQLREVGERLARGLGADQRLPRQAEVQVERRDQRSGRADRGVEEADGAAEQQEAPAQPDLFGACAEQQRAWRPGGRQHEDADQRARQLGCELLRDRDACEPHRQEQQRAPHHDGAVDVLALDPGAREVRDQLHGAVQRDRHQGILEQQHHREQRDAARHADDGGENSGEECDTGEDRELDRVQRR
jgi:hypothetical protein